MVIMVTVKLYTGEVCSTAEIILTEQDLRDMAEKKVMGSFQCDSCEAKLIEASFSV